MPRSPEDMCPKDACDGPRRTDWLAKLASSDPVKGFTWIPAGMYDRLTIEIGIRNRTWGSVRRFVARDRVAPHQYRLGDRDLTINESPDVEPLDPAKYDQVVMLSPWTVGSLINRDLTLVMSNAHMDHNPHLFRQRTRQGDLIAMADSGGYQLKFMEAGGTPIDPHAVIGWMNAACDVGFVLDVAPRPDHDDGKLEVLRALAMATRDTCRIMMSEKADSLHLLNIAQGDTFEHARRWIDIVKTDGYVGWGAPLSNQNSVRTGILLIKEYGVKWVHFLGFSDPQHLPLVAWLGRYARVTCDSGSYLGGRQHRSYRYADPYGRLKTLKQFTRSYEGPGPIATPLPCSCGVCSAFRYGDLFSWDEPVFGSLLNLHNMSVLSRHVAALNAVASQPNMTAEKYRDDVVAPYGERAVGLFRYLVIAMKRGLEAAEWEASKWSGKRSYDNLFREPNAEPCREMLLPEWEADPRMACQHSNLWLVPHYLNLGDPAVRKQLPRSTVTWLETAKTAGIIPPEDAPAA